MGNALSTTEAPNDAASKDDASLPSTTPPLASTTTTTTATDPVAPISATAKAKKYVEDVGSTIRKSVILDDSNPVTQYFDSLCGPVFEDDEEKMRNQRSYAYSEDISEGTMSEDDTLGDDTVASSYQKENRRSSRRRKNRSAESVLSQSDYESETTKSARGASFESEDDKPLEPPSTGTLLSKPLASSFAKRCYFTKAGIGKTTQHYEGLTLTGNVVLMLAAAMKLKGCPTICDEDLRRVEQTYPNQFSRLPDELLLSSGWRRISKYCHFSNKPIPDGVPFFHSKNRVHPTGGYYFLLAAAVGMIRPCDVEPLTRDTLVLLETDFPTSCDAAPPALIQDPNEWTLVDKFCFFSGGPINTEEDVYYQADFDSNPIFMLAFLSPSLTPEELYKLRGDVTEEPELKTMHDVEMVESVYDLTERDFDDLKLYHLGPCRALPPFILQPTAWTKVLPPHFLASKHRAAMRAQQWEDVHGVPPPEDSTLEDPNTISQDFTDANSTYDTVQAYDGTQQQPPSFPYPYNPQQLSLQSPGYYPPQLQIHPMHHSTGGAVPQPPPTVHGVPSPQQLMSPAHGLSSPHHQMSPAHGIVPHPQHLMSPHGPSPPHPQQLMSPHGPLSPHPQQLMSPHAASSSPHPQQLMSPHAASSPHQGSYYGNSPHAAAYYQQQQQNGFYGPAPKQQSTPPRHPSPNTQRRQTSPRHQDFIDMSQLQQQEYGGSSHHGRNDPSPRGHAGQQSIVLSPSTASNTVDSESFQREVEEEGAFVTNTVPMDEALDMWRHPQRNPISPPGYRSESTVNKKVDPPDDEPPSLSRDDVPDDEKLSTVDATTMANSNGSSSFHFASSGEDYYDSPDKTNVSSSYYQPREDEYYDSPENRSPTYQTSEYDLAPDESNSPEYSKSPEYSHQDDTGGYQYQSPPSTAVESVDYNRSPSTADEYTEKSSGQDGTGGYQSPGTVEENCDSYRSPSTAEYHRSPSTAESEYPEEEHTTHRSDYYPSSHEWNGIENEPPIAPSPKSEVQSSVRSVSEFSQSSAMRTAQDLLKRNRQRRLEADRRRQQIEDQQQQVVDGQEDGSVASRNSWDTSSEMTSIVSGSSVWTDTSNPADRSSRRALILQMAKARMKQHKSDSSSVVPSIREEETGAAANNFDLTQDLD